VTAATQMSSSVGCAAACRVLGLQRASFYRARVPLLESGAAAPRRKPARSLSEAKRQTALAHLHSERFVDQAPHHIYAAALLDEGVYIGSVST